MTRIVRLLATLCLVLVSALGGCLVDTRYQALRKFGLFDYPTQEQIKQNTSDVNYISAKAIAVDDIDENFTNIEDLTWLRDIAQRNRVVMLGEVHYHQRILNIRNRMFFALNSFDEYPILLLEGPFSFTPFLQYYLSLKDDTKAEAFFNQELNGIVTDIQEIELLGHIRRWNKSHPTQPLTVGNWDIEHRCSHTLWNILYPYFLQLDKKMSPDMELGELINLLRQWQKQAEQQQVVGKYPFITPDYIAAVIDNVESLVMAKKENWNLYRQRALVRNLTDPRFLGSYFKNGKVMMFGGAYHTASHIPYTKDDTYFREGVYLDQMFEPTKGRVYSIYCRAFGRSLGTMAGIDRKKIMAIGTSYHHILKLMQGAFGQGLIESNDVVLEDPLGPAERLILAKAADLNSNAMVVDSFDWESLLSTTNSQYGRNKRRIREHHEIFRQFDRMIYVTHSPLTISRTKPLI
jgi:hypothetical protein